MADFLQDRSVGQQLRGLANGLTIGVRIGAMVPQMFLRKGQGARFIGGKAAAAFVLMPFYGALLFPHHDLRPLMWFDCAFLFMCFLQRATSIRMRKRGYSPHSYYDGYCTLLGPNVSAKRELREKAVGEPLFVAIIGGLIYAFYDEPIGSLLLTSAACLVINHGMGQAWVDRQAMEMRDAMIDQQQVMERYRELYGDR